MIRPYRTVFTRDALDFTCRCDVDGMFELDAWLNRIERQPSLPGDFTEMDAAGRQLEVVVLHLIVICYWVDHAVREVRVLKIEPNI